MKKVIALTLLLVTFLGAFSQTPEWVEYCKLKKILLYEELPNDSAYQICCRMDSIYNGIPEYTILYDFLEYAIKCNQQEKTRELAFRLIGWRCWDYAFFDKPNFSSIKQTDYWSQLDSLSCAYRDRDSFYHYKKMLYDMQLSDQICRKAIHGEHTKEERDSIMRMIKITDSMNLAQLKELMALYGFPTWDKVGYPYAVYAWLIAQHSDSLFLHEYVEQLKIAVANGNANRKNLAYMIDRDLMNRNLPQIYGTQSISVFLTDDYREPRLWPVEDMMHLNDRREHMLLEPLDTTGLKIFNLEELKP